MLTTRVGIRVSFREMELYTAELFNSPTALWFSVLVLVVSALIVVYCKYYIMGEFNLNYYMVLIFMFIIRIVLLLIAQSLFVLILRWEGLGVSSFFLINYYQR